MKAERPRLVIRRRGSIHAEHHGGAWKIALADFMTALMALFLVLWVLSTATPQELRGLANYFSTPLAQAMAGGDETTASNSAIPGGGPNPVFHEGQVAQAHLRPVTTPRARRGQLRKLRAHIAAAVQANPQLASVRDQLHFVMTPKGLRIRLVDSDRHPMFDLGSARPRPYMRRLLLTIAPLLNKVPNKVSIYGYTDSLQYRGGPGGYSNWELSAERANASRRVLVEGGFDSRKLLVVSGLADRVPLPDVAPSDAENRRIEILVLTDRAAYAVTHAPEMTRPLGTQSGAQSGASGTRLGSADPTHHHTSAAADHGA